MSLLRNFCARTSSESGDVLIEKVLILIVLLGILFPIIVLNHSESSSRRLLHEQGEDTVRLVAAAVNDLIEQSDSGDIEVLSAISDGDRITLSVRDDDETLSASLAIPSELLVRVSPFSDDPSYFRVAAVSADQYQSDNSAEARAYYSNEPYKGVVEDEF